MRYHYKKPHIYLSKYGETYICNHVLYDKCTLYKIGEIGLAIIQQRFDILTKRSWWSEIDPWLIDDIYLHPKFLTYFKEKAAKCKNGLYPTVTVRQIMWALKMKPIKREKWETYFDRKTI